MQNDVRTIDSSHNQIRTEVVTTYQQLLHAYAIRSICFMEEHGVKALQTFDGNDYQATHIIVYAGDEPVGTMRIRWFRDFAKIERIAFREAYRNTHVLKAFGCFAFDHIARKGYDKIIGHAQPKYARLWRIIHGFKNAEGKAPVYFDGHPEPYIELVKELTPPLNAISASTDATVLFRTEGFWDQPSEFEVAAQLASVSAENIFGSHKTRKNTSTTVDFSRTYMKQVVAIHQAMFEKLLFDEEAAVSLDLAELFHAAGRTYLQISERINETYLSPQSLQD